MKKTRKIIGAAASMAGFCAMCAEAPDMAMQLGCILGGFALFIGGAYIAGFNPFREDTASEKSR